MVKNGLTFNPERVTDFRRLGGNHIIIETSRGFAVLAHARAGSIGCRREAQSDRPITRPMSAIPATQPPLTCAFK